MSCGLETIGRSGKKWHASCPREKEPLVGRLWLSRILVIDG